MLTILVVAVIVFFFGMGLIGLATPERITAIFGTRELTPAARNEVRAVYGGFGVAIAALLVAASRHPDLRAGIALAVAVALFGMAGGRVIAALVERPSGFYPVWFFGMLESAMALVLLAWM